jgi:hypothetical protein
MNINWNMTSKKFTVEMDSDQLGLLYEGLDRLVNEAYATYGRQHLALIAQGAPEEKQKQLVRDSEMRIAGILVLIDKLEKISREQFSISQALLSLIRRKKS